MTWESIGATIATDAIALRLQLHNTVGRNLKQSSSGGGGVEVAVAVAGASAAAAVVAVAVASAAVAVVAAVVGVFSYVCGGGSALFTHQSPNFVG